MADHSKLKPRNGLVLVKKHDDEEEVSPGGITLPMSVTNAGICYAEVMEVGNGRYLENGQRAELNDLKPGDVVLIQANRAMPLNAAGTKVMLVNEADILAVETK